MAIYDFFAYYTSADANRLPTNNGGSTDKVLLRHVSSIWNDNPIQTDDFATLSVKVRGRALDQVSVLASGLVNDWTGSAWSNLTATSNPAPHFRDVLTGRLTGDPMPADMVDDDGLVAWRSHCTSEGYSCDAVVDGRNAKDVLDLIAGCGRARPRMSETWGVALDKDTAADSPVQIFSPRNMRGFSFARGFPPLPSGFRVSFDDADNDYQADEVIIDDPDAAPDQGVRYEQLRLDGVVDSAAATIEALFRFKELHSRFVFYSGEVPIESLVCIKGDLVGVQHDVIAAEAGYARVAEVLTSGSNVTGIRLDGSVPVATEDAWSDPDLAWSDYALAWSPGRTGVAIRLKDQTSIVKQVTAADGAEETRELSFVTPFSHPGATVLAADCLVVAGRYGSEYARMKVLDITPGADFVAQMTFVPEAPELWD